jgi:hypothetical protein
MRISLNAFCLLLTTACVVSGANFQGVVVDRNCGDDILKHGRRIISKQRRDCSLMNHYLRDGYGIVTDDKKFFTFDDLGNKKAIQLLKNINHKDDLKIIVTGDLDGDTIKVTGMSLL